MKCIHCGQSTRVSYLRDETKRRRVCPSGHIFWTLEAVAHDIPVDPGKARLERGSAVARAVAEMEGEKSIVIASTLGVSDSYVRKIRLQLRRKMSEAASETA